jgi:hypothetical protein
MRNGKTPTESSSSPSHLKSIFDQSLAILCHAEDSVRVSRRSLPLRIDAMSLEKQAQSDAARALATLWKISGAKSVKLPNCSAVR